MAEGVMTMSGVGFREEAQFVDKKLNPIPYWRGALDVVNAWSKYQSVKKLLINATHSETKHKVWHVVEKSYGGNIRNVRNAEFERSVMVEEALAQFDELCCAHKVEGINRDWLYHKLRESRQYGSLRRKIKRRMAAWRPAESLRSLI